MKRSPLLRKSPLRSRRRPPRPAEDLVARAAWKDPRHGWCECGCDPKAFAQHLERHHVVSQSKLKQIGRHDELWNLANSMLLVKRHHAWHTDHFKLIRIEFVPVLALQFALEVLGEGPAAAYLESHYDCTVTV
jgi:hypothetical protein